MVQLSNGRDEQSALALIEKACIKRGQGELNEAISLLHRARDMEPSLSDTYLLESRYLIERGNEFTQALQLLATAHSLEADPIKCSEILRERGLIFVSLHRFSEAIECFSQAKGILPARAYETKADLYDHLSRASEQLGDYERAFKYHRLSLRAYRSANGRNIGDYHVRKVLLCEKLGDYWRLVECLSQLLQHEPDMIPISRGLLRSKDQRNQLRLKRLLEGVGVTLESHPSNHVARLLKGIIYFCLGRLPSAAEELQQVIGTEVGFYAHHLLGKLALTRTKLSKARYHLERAMFERGVEAAYRDLLLDLGSTYRQLRMWDEALRIYTMMLQEQPGDTDAMLACARIHELRGDREAAFEVYNRLETSNEGANALRYDKLGSLACSIGRYTEAIRYLTRAMGVSGEDEVLYILRARSYEGQGSYERALADLDRALSIIGERRDIFWREVLYRKANVLIHGIHDYEAGLAGLQELLEAREDDPNRALMLKGDCLKGMRRFGESVACYSQAADHRISSILLQEGELLADDDRLNEALLKFNEAFRREPRNWEVYYQAVSVYTRLGHVQEAARLAEKAIELHPSVINFIRRDRDLEPLHGLPAIAGKLGIPEP